MKASQTAADISTATALSLPSSVSSSPHNPTVNNTQQVDSESALRSTLVVDQEFKKLMPPLTDEERNGLEASIAAEGCRDPLIVWDNTIVDGHNRYELCTKLNVGFRVTERFFESRDDAKLWIINNQTVPQSNFNNADCKLHEAQKPVSVMRWLVNAVTKPGDLIVDPFSGSGTTGIAALQLGRRYHGIELDPKYRKLSEGRLAEYGKRREVSATSTTKELGLTQPATGAYIM